METLKYLFIEGLYLKYGAQALFLTASGKSIQITPPESQTLQSLIDRNPRQSQAKTLVAKLRKNGLIHGISDLDNLKEDIWKTSLKNLFEIILGDPTLHSQLHLERKRTNVIVTQLSEYPIIIIDGEKPLSTPILSPELDAVQFFLSDNLRITNSFLVEHLGKHAKKFISSLNLKVQTLGHRNGIFISTRTSNNPITYVYRLNPETNVQYIEPSILIKVLFVAANLEKESEKYQQNTKYLEFLKNLGTRYGISFTDISQIINEYKEFQNT